MKHCPEQVLWQEVLFRQVDDALNGPASLEGSKEERIAVCTEARRYLTTPGKQLSILCALAGIEADALIDRMRAKIANAPTPEQLASAPKKYRATLSASPKIEKRKHVRLEDRQYTVQGETLTLAQWAERTGNSVAIISSRINDGWSAERAIMQPKGTRQRSSWGFTGSTQETKPRRTRRPNTNATRITFNGQSLTILEWSQITGINKATLAKRLKNGWPVERVLECKDNRAKPEADTVADAHAAPGVVSLFGTEQGTGGGRSAQDSLKIDFPNEGTRT